MNAERFIFHGRVQGVGFRYTTHRIATRYPVTGFVRNLHDGTVELVIAGEPETINRVAEEIDQAFDGNITSIDRTILEQDAEFSSFEIRR